MNLQSLIRPWAATAMVTAATLLTACGGGGSSGSTATGQGTLRVALTDAPSCGYDEVNVTVEKVRVHRSSSAADTDPGWSEVVLSPAKRVNLLDLTNGVLAELGHIGGDKRTHLAGFKLFQAAIAGTLRFITMYRSGFNTIFFKLFSQLIHCLFGTRENQHLLPIFGAYQVRH